MSQNETSVPSNMLELVQRHPCLVRDLTDFSKERNVGRGGTAEVFLAYDSKLGVQYAVKQLLSEFLSGKDLKRYVREIHAMAVCNNRFIIPLNGFTAEPPYAVILEYLENGSLDDAIFSQNPKVNITDNQMNAIAIGVASGMSHLHALKYMHRDLKPGNVLLDNKCLPRLCDFGLARLDDSVMLSKGAGTPVYMAPELMKGGQKYTQKVDVYAFGIMLAEMSERKRAYTGFQSAEALMSFVSNENGRPTLTSKTPTPLKKLITRCWDKDPENRPTFQFIYDQLSSGEIIFKGAESQIMKKFVQTLNESQRKSTQATKQVFVNLDLLITRLKKSEPPRRSVKRASDDEDDDIDLRGKAKDIIVKSKRANDSDESSDDMPIINKEYGDKPNPLFQKFPDNNHQSNDDPINSTPINLINGPIVLTKKQKQSHFQRGFGNTSKDDKQPQKHSPLSSSNSQNASSFTYEAQKENPPQVIPRSNSPQFIPPKPNAPFIPPSVTSSPPTPSVASNPMVNQQVTYISSNPSPQSSSETQNIEPPPEMRPYFISPIKSSIPEISSKSELPNNVENTSIVLEIINDGTNPLFSSHIETLSQSISTRDYEVFSSIAIGFLIRGSLPEPMIPIIKALCVLMHRDNTFIDIAISSGVFRTSPFASPVSIQYCLDMLAIVFAKRPALVDESFFGMLAFLENIYPNEIVVLYKILIDSIAQVSKQVIEFIISRGSIFARNTACIPFISILGSIIMNNSSLLNDILPQIRSQLVAFSQTTSIDIAFEAYKAISHAYSDSMQLDFLAMFYHIQFSNLTDIISSILLRVPSLPVSLVVSKALIKASQTSKKASLVLMNYANHSLETANVFLYDLSWTCTTLPTAMDTFSLALILLKYPPVRYALGRKEEFIMLIRMLVASKNSFIIISIVSIIRRLSLDNSLVLSYEKLGLFHDFFSVSVNINDESVTNMMLVMIDTIIRITFVPSILVAVPKIAEIIKNQEQSYQQALSVLVMLSSIPESFRTIIENGIQNSLQVDQTSHARMVLQNLEAIAASSYQ